MTDRPSRLPRSPELMSPSDSALLVVDVQEKLIPHIAGHARVVWNIRRLLDAAQILSVRAAGTEQYPAGLGATCAELAEHAFLLRLTGDGCNFISQFCQNSDRQGADPAGCAGWQAA